MKAILVCILILTLFNRNTVVFAQSLPRSGLIAHYNFNRDMAKDSSRIFDLSGNQNHGTVMGTVNYATDRFGVPCSALSFDGQSYVTVPSSRSLKKPQRGLSIAVWFRLSKGADFFNQWITICCKSNESGESPENPQYRMQATAQTVSINTEFTERIIPQIKYEVWYFYCYTFDGNKVITYLDGRIFFEMDYNSTLNSNDMPLEIGHDLPGAEEFFLGSMDDLRIFDRALSENEIDLLYQDRLEANAIDRCILPPAIVVSSPTIIPAPPPTTIDSSQMNQQQSNPSNTQKPPSPPPLTDAYTGLPDSIEEIPIKYQKTVEVKNRQVSIYPYDNEKEDGDIVSININGVWVRDHYELKKKKDPPSNASLIRCSLNPGKYNYLISKAWNKGTIGVNTLTILIDDGSGSPQEVQINSDVGLSGGIRIICKK
jgi:hypothetical protein